MGMEDGVAFQKVVSGRLPVSAIDKLPSLPRLHYASRSFIVHRGAFDSLGSVDVARGLATSQADLAHRVDVVRTTLGLTGRGQKIGLLSDSVDMTSPFFGSVAKDVETGDLPPKGILVVQDGSPGDSDEGRAMAQLIHDLAPHAALSFATTDFGAAVFANNILRLAELNDILVDDIGIAAEPFFQDGIVAQAAQTASEKGVPFVSATGNDGIRAYQAQFRDAGIPTAIRSPTGEVIILTTHDFDPSDGVVDHQVIYVPVFESFGINLQWSEPSFSASEGPTGSGSDLEVILFDMADNPLSLRLGSGAAGGIDRNIGRDAVELMFFTNDGDVDVDGVPGPDTAFKLKILLFEGPAPKLMRYLWTPLGGVAYPQTFFDGAPTVWGHPNVPLSIAVAAAYYADTPRFGEVDPPLAEYFTTHGQTPILFDRDGNATLEMRKKPDIAAADGTHTTFFKEFEDNFDFFNFFGTSAAAPHVAAVISLLNEWQPGIKPQEIRDVLFKTAIDMEDYIDLSQQGPGDFDVGHDNQTGHGLMDAYAAVTLLDKIPVCLTKTSVKEVACAGNNGSPCRGTSGDDALGVSVTSSQGSVTADAREGNDCISVTITGDNSALDLMRVVGGRGSDYIVIDGKVPPKAKVEVSGASSGGDDGSRDTILLKIEAGSDGRGVEVTVTNSGEGSLISGSSTTDTILNFGVTKDEKCRADVIKVGGLGSSQLSYDDSRGEVRAGDKLVAMIYPPLPKDALTIDGSTVTRTCSFTVSPFQQRPAMKLPPITSRVGAEFIPYIGLKPGTRDLPIPGCPASLLDDTNSAFVTNLIPDGPQAICGTRITFESTVLDKPLPVFDLERFVCNGASLAQRLLFAELDRPGFIGAEYHNEESRSATVIHVFRGCESDFFSEPSVLRGEVLLGPVFIAEPGLYAFLINNFLCDIGITADVTITCPEPSSAGVVEPPGRPPLPPDDPGIILEPTNGTAEEQLFLLAHRDIHN
ncbi:unnamed protein product [Vitrella brassicaformis CCMP3155]|uniref:subtilisin n=3 Tax=Vitrella brassicaformis TaxID=1169539 RepID=A0A0G4H0C2_VITBC|nr:unnamed protein product [Vitrella brassicaformis CCMP3155]|eukprot:CEM36733.1 unnamed protein product [Vitrella brassicaformis CCMP3155]